MTGRLSNLDRQRDALRAKHPGWLIWFVPLATGGVQWCAHPEPTIHAYSPEDLSKDIGLAEDDLAKRLAEGRTGQ